MDDFYGFHVGGYTIHPYIEYLGSNKTEVPNKKKTRIGFCHRMDMGVRIDST